MLPHDGVGGWGPNPRKLKDAPTRMTNPMSNVILTTSGDMMLGSTSLNAMRHLLAPKERLACT